MSAPVDPYRPNEPDPTYFPTPQAKASYYTSKCVHGATQYLKDLSTTTTTINKQGGEAISRTNKQMGEYMKADAKILKDASFYGLIYGTAGSVSAYIGCNRMLKMNKP